MLSNSAASRVRAFLRVPTSIPPLPQAINDFKGIRSFSLVAATVALVRDCTSNRLRPRIVCRACQTGVVAHRIPLRFVADG